MYIFNFTWSLMVSLIVRPNVNVVNLRLLDLHEGLLRMDVLMDEGRERDKTSRGGGPPYAARSLPQYNSALATRVLLSTYVCVKGEKA